MVGGDRYLGPIRLGLLRIIDPVEHYMRKSGQKMERPRRKRRLGRHPKGWTSYEPVAVEPPQQIATMPEPAPPARSEDWWSTFEARRAEQRTVLMQENQGLIDSKTQELLRRGEASIQTADGSVRLRLVRFRNGAVLEHWESSPDSDGYGHVRLGKGELADPGLLANYLVEALLHLSDEADPPESQPAP